MFSVHRFLKYIVTAVQIKIKYSVPNFEWCYTKIIFKQAGLHLWALCPIT